MEVTRTRQGLEVFKDEKITCIKDTKMNLAKDVVIESAGRGNHKLYMRPLENDSLKNKTFTNYKKARSYAQYLLICERYHALKKDNNTHSKLATFEQWTHAKNSA